MNECRREERGHSVHIQLGCTHVSPCERLDNTVEKTVRWQDRIDSVGRHTVSSDYTAKKYLWSCEFSKNVIVSQSLYPGLGP